MTINEHDIAKEKTAISSEDPFYSEENQKPLLKNIEDMKNGINCAEHENDKNLLKKQMHF